MPQLALGENPDARRLLVRAAENHQHAVRRLIDTARYAVAAGAKDPEARELLGRADEAHERATEHLGNAVGFAAHIGASIDVIADVIGSTPQTAQEILNDWETWPER
jgi:hypothetical protein